mgnify:CR=1 FL=1|tara:strand:- start:3670 stop:4851 length:1182 start_codon:yes stop_codon:yes gene_type:complete
MHLLYNISIWIYFVAIHISALFNRKAKQWINGRKNLFKKLKQINSNNNIVWFHCASLGEYEQGRPIIKSYKIKYPEHKILLTFFSPSGYEIRKDTSLADFVFYLPQDTQSNASKFINIVNPIKVIFIKYEFWFNYMSELKKRNIPFYSVSTILRENQILFKYSWFKKQLNNVTHFFVQEKKSANFLRSIGFTNTTISGDSRFDSVRETANNRIPIPTLKEFSQQRPTIICGSTWEKDEKLLIKFIKQNTDYNYIIAPHEMNNISRLRKETNGLLYSNIDVKDIKSTNVIIIDNIGLLSKIYSYANIAYIGGGFGSGIHNILEAATFGLPIIFGPNHKKSNEAKELISLGGAISITNYKELESAITYFNNFDSEISTNYIDNNTGATKIILEAL